MKLKNIKRKRLNNKGFTLIELLAVVVILAVVMGIAMTSVLSAMNKSRGGSLEDSALTIAQAFNQKYTESLVSGIPDDVYGKTDGESEPLTNGYNFQSDAIYYISKYLAPTFNISEDSYAFADSDENTNEDFVEGVTINTPLKAANVGALANSFVTFSAGTGKFIVCMFANVNGSYYVDNYKTTSEKLAISTINNIALKAAEGKMYACSDGNKSW